MPATHAIGICHAIMAEPLTEAFGFAHVKNHFGGILHQINAGTLG